MRHPISRCPSPNACAVRFVRPIKFEYLDQMIPPGERRLRRTIDEYAKQSHVEGTQRGLGNDHINGARSLRDRADPTATATGRPAQIALSCDRMRRRPNTGTHGLVVDAARRSGKQPVGAFSKTFVAAIRTWAGSA
jgi:hypothetical protein